MNYCILLTFGALIVALANTQSILNDVGKKCDVKCPPGHFIDVQACLCVSFDGYKPPTQPSPTSHCPLVRCPLNIVPCAEYRVDDQGCQTCQCKCLDFGRNCPTDCKHGTEWIKDENGCKVCACADPILDRWPETCPPVCAMYCPYGNVLDANGCPICACEGDFLSL